jgi:ABC-type nitrate/sulfonate/bicarbonate transport system substrate-binding protein
MIKLALISEGANTWPVYAAQSRGLWREAGVEVEVTVTGSSIQQLDALKRGGFDIGFQQVDHIVRGVEQGADLFIFMAQSHAPDLSLVVAPDIAKVADLKGKNIIVDDARTGYSLLLKKLFARHGLAPADTHFVNVGGSQERFDAMKAGAGAASFLNPPFDRNLLAAGFKSLGTSSEFFPTYPGPIAATRRAWAAAHRDDLIAFIRGFNRAYAWLQDAANTAEAIALLPARLNMSADAAARALKNIFSKPRPQLTDAAVREVIDTVWAAEGYAAEKSTPSRYLDLQFLRAAEA